MNSLGESRIVGVFQGLASLEGHLRTCKHEWPFGKGVSPPQVKRKDSRDMTMVANYLQGMG